ncbi:SMI1/KNR4 family protein [Embleya sp. NPDC055664]|uniref:SMI1/KNR4 family protein n=1 Tax=unclassified Embleya TaxID=2699296 RepID=UPI0036BB3A06
MEFAHMSSFESLRSLLGDPDWWVRSNSDVWIASEEYLGLRLPSDYKQFMDFYGPGLLDEYLLLDLPEGPSSEEVVEFWSLASWVRARESRPDAYPYAFAPDRNGLIEWGSDQHSNSYFFLPSAPDASDWKIVITSEAGEWFKTDGTFTEYLVRCFQHSSERPSFVDRSWPRPGARFRPFNM